MKYNTKDLIIILCMILFLILTFLINLLLKTNIETSLSITYSTCLLLIIICIVWQKNQISNLWPLLLGVLVTCWWPYFTWISTDYQFINKGYIIVNNKWYNSLIFKLSISLLPIIIGYIIILYNKKSK